MTLNRVTHADCIEGIAHLPAGSVSLVFADLPYGTTRAAWDRRVDLTKLWERLRRACKPTAVIVFTAQQPFTSELVTSNLAWFRFEMIWRKNKSTGFLNAKRRPLPAHENVLVFYDKQPAYRPQMTDGHAPGHAVNQRLSKTTIYGATPRRRSWGGSTLRYPTSVLELPVVNGDDPRRVHVSQKPEALPRWFIDTYTQPGDLVLDPAAGSGSTMRAAVAAGRHFVGFETDAAMVRKANDAALWSES